MIRRLLLIFAVVAAFGAGLLITRPVTKVQATMPSCVSTGPQCGTDNGTQTSTRSRDYNWDCPDGYSDQGHQSWWPKQCRKVVSYSCDTEYENIHGTNRDVTRFYAKVESDKNHCHRTVWHNVITADQNLFKGWHGNDEDYSSPNHGTWEAAFNNHISELGDVDYVYDYKDEVKVYQNCDNGYVVNPSNSSQCIKTSACNTGVIQYDSCDPAGTCPTKCGVEASSVSDGKGGTIQCPATDACEQNETKHVDVVEACDGSATVTVYGGDTRRTWRVEGVEAWIDYNENHQFSASSINAVIEWKHKDQWEVADESYVKRMSAENCEIDPTPTPTPTSTPSDQPRNERVLSFNRLCNMDVELVLNYFEDGHGVKDKEIKFYYMDEEKIAKTNEAGRAGVTYGFKGEDDVEAKFDGGDTKTTKVTDIQPSDCPVNAGQVLGATTMAATGGFSDALMNVMGISGSLLAMLGIKRYGKKN